MNYPALRWAVEEYRREGASKPILFVIAYRADRDTGECWAGQRRIAREAGVSRTHVQRVMAELVRDGVLEVVDNGQGPRPAVVRIAPAWVEGETSATDVVEGQAEVIHNPPASGHMTWPQQQEHDDLVATLLGASGHMESPNGGLVATSDESSGHMTSALSSGNTEKVLNQGFSTSREVHVRDAAAEAAGGVAAVSNPPEVSESDKAWLQSRGLGLKVKPRPGNGTVSAVGEATLPQSEQLAELKRRFPEDFKPAEGAEVG